jgi:glutathione S-transferase
MDNGGDYRMVNPLGFVPALELDDGTVLTEGAAIVQYIADQVPATQLAPPNGTLARSKFQSWLNFIASEVRWDASACSFTPRLPTLQRRCTASVSRTPCLPRSTSAQNHYLLGNAFSLADAYVLVVLNWSRSAMVDLSPYPHLLEHRKRVG